MTTAFDQTRAIESCGTRPAKGNIDKGIFRVGERFLFHGDLVEVRLLTDEGVGLKSVNTNVHFPLVLFIDMKWIGGGMGIVRKDD